jgi:hypothetical protein
MSAPEIKRTTANPKLLSASWESTSAETTIDLPAHHKYEIEPEALELLREFFLLLDQWDRQQGE